MYPAFCPIHKYVLPTGYYRAITTISGIETNGKIKPRRVKGGVASYFIVFVNPVINCCFSASVNRASACIGVYIAGGISPS
jgi:hypothetical protein